MIELLLRTPRGDVTVSARGDDWNAAVQPAVEGPPSGRKAYFQVLSRIYTLQGKAVSASREVPYSMANLLEGLEGSGYNVEIVRGSARDARSALTPLQPPGEVTA